MQHFHKFKIIAKFYIPIKSLGAKSFCLLDVLTTNHKIKMWSSKVGREEDKVLREEGTKVKAG